MSFTTGVVDARNRGRKYRWHGKVMHSFVLFCVKSMRFKNKRGRASLLLVFNMYLFGVGGRDGGGGQIFTIALYDYQFYKRNKKKGDACLGTGRVETGEDQNHRPQHSLIFPSTPSECLGPLRTPPPPSVQAKRTVTTFALCPCAVIVHAPPPPHLPASACVARGRSPF